MGEEHEWKNKIVLLQTSVDTLNCRCLKAFDSNLNWRSLLYYFLGFHYLLSSVDLDTGSLITTGSLDFILLDPLHINLLIFILRMSILSRDNPLPTSRSTDIFLFCLSLGSFSQNVLRDLVGTLPYRGDPLHTVTSLQLLWSVLRVQWPRFAGSEEHFY